MIAFIDDHRGNYGVEPICWVLPIATSTYHDHFAKRRDPSRLSSRAQRDQALKPEVMRVFAENFGVYRVRKVWREMRRESFYIVRCTVERLMRDLGLQGVIRGKPVRTTACIALSLMPETSWWLALLMVLPPGGSSTITPWRIGHSLGPAKRRYCKQRHVLQLCWRDTFGQSPASTPRADYRYLEINRRIQQAHPGVLDGLVRGILAAGGSVRMDNVTDLIHINEEFTAFLVIARCFTTSAGPLRWKIRLDSQPSPDITVAARLGPDNVEVRDFYLFPRLTLEAALLRLCEHNGLSLDAFRFPTADHLFRMAARSPFRRAA